MAIRISDFPGLLPLGVNPVDLEELRRIGVVNFPLSKTRAAIFEGFLKIWRRLFDLQICGDVIVDGSFLTEEIEPLDLDFTLCVNDEFYLGASAEQKEYMDWIGDDKTIKSSHSCDCYLCVESQPGSPLHFDGIQTRTYWTNLYRYSKVIKRERGIAVLSLPGRIG